MQKNDSGVLTLSTNLSNLLARGTRVIETAGLTAPAGVADMDLGVLTRDQHQDEAHCSVDGLTKPGTQIAIGDAAIPANTRVFTAAAGKVSATQAPGAFLRGVTRSSCLADGGLVEIVPVFGQVAGT